MGALSQIYSGYTISMNVRACQIRTVRIEEHILAACALFITRIRQSSTGCGNQGRAERGNQDRLERGNQRGQSEGTRAAQSAGTRAAQSAGTRAAQSAGTRAAQSAGTRAAQSAAAGTGTAGRRDQCWDTGRHDQARDATARG